MTQADPHNEPVSHKHRGDALLNEGRLEEAAACYRQAIASTPNDADAYINLGFVSLEQNRQCEAVRYLGEFDSQFTEKLVYLPAVVPFLPEESAPGVNALPALTNGYVTFGSFNRISKLSSAAIALWSQLLRALPKCTNGAGRHAARG